MKRRVGLGLAATFIAALAWGSLAAAVPERSARQNATGGETKTRATPLTLGELQDTPSDYMGRTITVDASVEDVWGPRLFTVNDPRWGDLDGEVMVFIPTVLAAGVREGDRVTITATLKPFVEAEFAQEWGWQKLAAETNVDVASKPVLVASHVEASDRIVQLALTPPTPTPPNKIPPSPVGTSDTGVSRADVTFTDASRVVASTDAIVGRTVDLKGLGVSGVSSQGGFVVNAGLGQLFVLPATGQDADIGNRVDLQGLVLRMPRRMRSQVDGPAQMNRDIYIFATAVTKR